MSKKTVKLQIDKCCTSSNNLIKDTHALVLTVVWLHYDWTVILGKLFEILCLLWMMSSLKCRKVALLCFRYLYEVRQECGLEESSSDDEFGGIHCILSGC